MSKYTTEVRYICESLIGLKSSVNYEKVEGVISEALSKVFDFDFPIFDENYRSVLETKILRHYYTREIGLETVGLWKLKLSTKLNEIMPYYNQLYRSELLEFNPLYSTNLTRKGNKNGKNDRDERENVTENRERNENGNSNSSNNVNGTDYQLYSDTPQGSLNGVESGTYLTNATKSTNANSSNSETSGSSRSTETNGITRANTGGNTSTEDYLETIVGFTGANASEMLMKYRKTFLNIDMMVIGELEELFMQLW